MSDISSSVKETESLGQEFSKQVKNLPLIIILKGPVGAGKTSFARGFVRGYLKKDNVVSSPTYSLMNRYKAGKKEVIHVDLYRIVSEDDLESIGFFELIEKKRVIIIEWGELLYLKLPKTIEVAEIEFQIIDEEKRKLKIKPL